MKYYYLDISLEFQDGSKNHVSSVAYFKKHILQCMNKVFGEIAANVPIDILKYNEENTRSIIRIPSDYYVKLHSALTLCGDYEGKSCAFRVYKTSDLLLTLCADSRPDGKDIVIFATEEDHKVPSSVQLPAAEASPGLILPNGDINWNCPCLGGMATGPCGVEFREAFSCFHYSDTEPKGSDCYERFKFMQECMEKFPKLYNKDSLEEDEDEVAKALEESSKKKKKEEKCSGK